MNNSSNDLPVGWSYKKLCELSHIKTGPFGAQLHSYDYDAVGVPLVLVKNITNNSIDSNDIPLVNYNKAKELEDKFSLVKGDIVFSRVGAVGRCALITEEQSGWLFSGQTLRVRFKRIVSPEFYVQYFHGEGFQKRLNEVTIGSTRKSTSTKVLEDAYVTVPPIPEQKKIAKILSTVDGHIDEVDGMIEDLKELKKGLMQKLLTEGIGHTEFKDSEVGRIPVEWEVYKLGRVSDFRQGFQIPRSEQITTRKDGYERYLYISDFFSNKNMLFIENSDKFYRISCKDICIANTGNTCGKSFRGVEGILSNNMFKIFPNNDLIIEEYYWHYLQSEFYWKQLRSLFNSAGQPHVGHKNMSDLKIALPAVEEQRRIVKVLDAIDERIELFSIEAIDLKDAKKGLMQQLLTGKTRVKIDN